MPVLPTEGPRSGLSILQVASRRTPSRNDNQGIGLGCMDLAKAASGQWYTSGTFWAAIGAVAVLVSTVALAWVTLRAANPKRRLLYSMPIITPLLNARPDLPADLEVRRGGAILRHPHFVNVELVNRGRLDIRRDAFDGGEPLCLDVGATIIECLKVTTSPSDRPKPQAKIEGSALLIGPSLLGRREIIVFSLLVDGPSPNLRRPEQTLIDVDIRQRDPDREWNFWRTLSVVNYVIGAMAAVVTIIAFLLFVFR
jgi:hypothetical protein